MLRVILFEIRVVESPFNSIFCKTSDILKVALTLDKENPTFTQFCFQNFQLVWNRKKIKTCSKYEVIGNCSYNLEVDIFKVNEVPTELIFGRSRIKIHKNRFDKFFLQLHLKIINYNGHYNHWQQIFQRTHFKS